MSFLQSKHDYHCIFIDDLEIFFHIYYLQSYTIQAPLLSLPLLYQGVLDILLLIARKEKGVKFFP
nr:MAG TPA: hypothetical protein [Caudoviricetes sp.]